MFTAAQWLAASRLRVTASQRGNCAHGQVSHENGGQKKAVKQAREDGGIGFGLCTVSKRIRTVEWITERSFLTAKSTHAPVVPLCVPLIPVAVLFLH